MTDNKIDQEYEQVKQDIAKLRADLSSLVSALKEIGIEKITDARSLLADESIAREALKQAYAESREQGARAANALEAEINRRPITSVLVAVGLGFLLAKLLQRGGDT